MGIPTPNLPAAVDFDDVLANLDSGAGSQTVRVTKANVAVKLESLLPFVRIATGVVAVADHFQAGDPDYTQAYIRALAALPAGGGALELPAFPHSISGPINITKAVWLRGQGYSEGPTPVAGTWISRTSLTAKFNVSGIGARGFAATNLAIYDTLHPAPGPGWAPAAYPDVFDCQNTLGKCLFDHILFANVAKGIYSKNSGRLYIGTVLGQFFNYGARIDEAYDENVIDYLRCWPMWSQDANVIAYMFANCDLLYLERVDNPLIDTVSGIYARSIVRFSGSVAGVCQRAKIGVVFGDHTLKTLWFDSNADVANCDIERLDAQGENPATLGVADPNAVAIRIDSDYVRLRIDAARSDIMGASHFHITTNTLGNIIDVDNLWFAGFDSLALGLPAFFCGNSPTDINRINIRNRPYNNSNSYALASPATNGIVTIEGVAAYGAVGPSSVGGNLVDNGNFSVNQRGVSGTVVLAAGQYGHDRWRAGAAGATYTFAADAFGNRTITLTAGTLEQVVDTRANESDTVILSWTGTARGRANGGAWVNPYALGYGSAPELYVGGGAMTIEFGGAAYPVTLSFVRLEMGDTAHAFETRRYEDRLFECQAHLQVFKGAAGALSFGGYAAGAGAAAFETITLLRAMRAAPTASLIGAWSTVNAAAPTIGATESAALLAVASSGAGNFTAANPVDGGFLVSAEP